MALTLIRHVGRLFHFFLYCSRLQFSFAIAGHLNKFHTMELETFIDQFSWCSGYFFTIKYCFSSDITEGDADELWPWSWSCCSIEETLMYGLQSLLPCKFMWTFARLHVRTLTQGAAQVDWYRPQGHYSDHRTSIIWEELKGFCIGDVLEAKAKIGWCMGTHTWALWSTDQSSSQPDPLTTPIYPSSPRLAKHERYTTLQAALTFTWVEAGAFHLEKASPSVKNLLHGDHT